MGRENPRTDTEEPLSTQSLFRDLELKRKDGGCRGGHAERATGSLFSVREWALRQARVAGGMLLEVLVPRSEPVWAVLSARTAMAGGSVAFTQ